MTSESGILHISVHHPRLDAAASPAFREEVAEHFESRPERVLLDLREVEFIDSTGLGVLVSLLKRTGPGGRIAVAGANAAVRRLFQITRLDDLFLLCDSTDEAHAALT